MTTTCSTYYNHHGQPDKIYNEEGYIALHGDSVSYHFFERDYLGSVRAVFDLYGNLEQTNDYNVTGIPSSRHLGNADVHKHTGKEFQGFNGLAWYDNNARYYDPILARFTTLDPLAEKYPWLSPYNHCANNPLKYVDLNGLSPIYNQYGSFIGTSKEGFTGNILIYNGDEEYDFSQMTEQQILDNMVVFRYDKIAQNIDNDVKSKIWAHVVSNFEGMPVYDEIFSMNSIRDAQISYEERDGASWVTYYKEDPTYKPKIIGTGGYSYETTVENIASSVIVHEWYSHGKKYNSDEYKSHRLAYKNVINFKRLWDKTTDEYKKFNLQQLLKYTKKETGRNNVDPRYRRLYNKYVK